MIAFNSSHWFRRSGSTWAGGSAQRSARRRRGALGLIAGVLFGLSVLGPLGISVPSAHAQMRMGMGGGMSSTVGVDAIDEYTRILGLSEDQKAAVIDLHLSYLNQSNEASSRFTKEIGKLSQEFQEEQDPSVWQKKMPEIQERYQADTRKADASFLSDIKALLTPDQSAKWVQVERAHNRRKSLPSGQLAGENVDLFQILGSAGVEEPFSAEIQGALDRYSVELDGALKDRDAKMESATKKLTENALKGGVMNMDIEGMRRDMLEMRKLGMPVRGINERFGSMIQQALPENAQEKFREALMGARFPAVYRNAHPETAMNAAMEFSDITADQKSSISSMLESYSRDVRPFNQRWADEITKAEADGGGDEMMANWQRMMSGGAGGEESDLAKARKARRQFDKDMVDKLKGILTEAQRERLPERQAEGWGGMGQARPRASGVDRDKPAKSDASGKDKSDKDKSGR
jgi:hypothetical protein